MKKYSSLLVIVFLIAACSERNNITSPQEIHTSYITSDDLNIIAPEYADDWKPGTTQVIRWELPDVVKTVQITLLRKDEVKRILSYVWQNTGSFTWKIPGDLSQSVHYRIKIDAVDWPAISRTTRDFFIRTTEIPISDY